MALLAALVGTVGSVYLTHEHIKIAPAATTQPASAPAQAPASAPAASEADEGLFGRICTGFVSSSCEQVSQSKWGRFPFGQPAGKPSVPTAELGLIYFIFAICWLLLIGSASPSRWWVHLLFAMVAAMGLGASVFLDVIMWTQLAFWCPFCLASHVASLIIFLCVLLLWPRAPKVAAAGPGLAAESTPIAEGETRASTFEMPPGELPVPSVALAREPRPWPTFRAVVTTLIVFLLAVCGQHFFWLRASCGAQLKETQKKMEKSACQEEINTWKRATEYYRRQFNRYDERWQFVYMSWAYEPALPLVIDGEPFHGPATARHTIVLFSDVQCPACARFEEYLRNIVIPASERYGGVKIIFKHYPLCKECNPYNLNNLHPQACMAARAIEAARILGGTDAFWQMHDWLISHRERMKGADKAWFVKQSQQFGFNANAFAEAMDSKEALDRIRRHVEEGENLGKGIVPDKQRDDYKVTGTPTVLVDYRYMRAPSRSRAWEEILKNPPLPPPGAKPQAQPSRSAHSAATAAPSPSDGRADSQPAAR